MEAPVLHEDISRALEDPVDILGRFPDVLLSLDELALMNQAQGFVEGGFVDGFQFRPVEDLVQRSRLAWGRLRPQASRAG